MYSATCRDLPVPRPPRWGRVGPVNRLGDAPSSHRTAAAGRAPSSYDTWSALLAGEAAWSGANDPPAARDQVAAGVQALALAVVAAQVWLFVPERAGGVARPGLLWAAGAAVTVTSVLFAVRPLGILLGRPPRSSHVAWRMAWRTLGGLVLLASLVVVLPGWSALGLWPMGVATGADAVLGGWAVGVRMRPVQWWVRVISSPAHLGAVGALLALLITRSDSDVVSSVISLYVALQATLLAAWLTALLLLHLERSIDRERAHDAEHGIAAEHRRLAHWIHDDVCADLQLTALRLRTGSLDPGDVAGELSELDHRLRLRQQQEIIESGQARLAELLQPYVRRAQAAGVAISEVPTLNDAALRVDRPTAHLFARAVSTLTSNALNAGATELGIRVTHDGDTVHVSVIDDAGGFLLADVPAGRGLDTLVHDVGPGNLEVLPYGRGSRVTVSIPLSPDDPEERRHGTHPAR